jgi:hypothetical protein
MNILGDITQADPAFTVDGTLLGQTTKEVQRFLLLLLTDVDTDPFGRGTRIPGLIGGTNLEPTKWQGIYSIACSDVLKIMKKSYTTATPANERIVKADPFVDESTESDSISVTITLTTADGTTQGVTLPVNIDSIGSENK